MHGVEIVAVRLILADMKTVEWEKIVLSQMLYRVCLGLCVFAVSSWIYCVVKG
jgi:hypothetical protein